MPQPLSRFGPIHGLSMANIGMGVLHNNRYLATWAMECISAFAHLETHVQQLYFSLAGGGRSDAATNYLRHTNNRRRSEDIRRVARDVLTEERYNLCKALLHVFDNIGDDRNKLAHWTWGFTPSIPDGLLLRDPKILIDHEYSTDPRLPLEIFHEQLMARSAAGIIVWQEEDFQSLVRKIGETAGLFMSFRMLIECPSDNIANRQAYHFSREPAIAHYLNNFQVSR